MLFTHSITNFNSLVTFILLSANAVSLEYSEFFLSFGKEIICIVLHSKIRNQSHHAVTNQMACLESKDQNELFTTQSRLLTTLKMKPFENIFGKGENAGHHFKNKFHFFSPFYFFICKCFQFGPV